MGDFAAILPAIRERQQGVRREVQLEILNPMREVAAPRWRCARPFRILCCGTRREGAWLHQVPAIDLRKPEEASSGRHDDIGIPDQADTAADAEASDCGNDWNLALIHRSKGVVAALVGSDRASKPSVFCISFNVDAGV